MLAPFPGPLASPPRTPASPSPVPAEANKENGASEKREAGERAKLSADRQKALEAFENLVANPEKRPEWKGKTEVELQVGKYRALALAPSL